MKLASLIVLLITVPVPATALNLTQMQEMALANRAVVKEFATEIDKSRQDVRIARSPFYPTVDLSYNAYALDDDSETERRENSAFLGLINWNLFDGFADSAALDAARQRQDIEDLRMRALVQDIQLAVALRYLDVYNQRAQTEVAEDTLTTLTSLYEDSENRFEVGLVDKNTVLRFRVDAANARLALQARQADLRKAINLLSRTIGATISLAELDFNDFSGEPAITGKSDYESRMLASRSEIKALEKLGTIAELSIKEARGAYYPELDVAAGYRTYSDAYLNGVGEFTNEELRAELIITYNLFSGFSNEAELAKAKIEVRTVNYQLIELQDDLTTELRNLFVDYEVSLANVAVAREDIGAAEENLRITELKYKEGLQSQLDLLDAVSNLSRAQSNYVAVIRTVFANYYRITRMVEDFPHDRS
ncbi:MAG: TolC family protein [Desulfofustis sp. PB-SRB1]|jgi:outer membrane protein|nr:TolC family protein [Desulfofustis sp. PB-SRB1]